MTSLTWLLPFSLSFTSAGYLLCLALLALLMRVLPRRCAVPLLFAASVAFYFFMMPAALPILALFTVAVYFAGLAVAGRQRKVPSVPSDGTTDMDTDVDMDTPTAPRKKTLAALFLCGTVAFLAVFKYLPWIAGGVTGREFSLLVPLGISYFTFSAISYLADLSAGKIEAQRSFLALSLYIFFFPKITAGPIERPAPFFDSLRRLEDPASPPLRDGRSALMLLLSGFLRKLAAADLLAPAVSAVFDHPGAQGQTGFSLLLAAFLFAWQLYADFSGYTDIARGSALLLGVPLPENFDTPYAAASIKEFWRRWHISLSSFLRDYIYIPLGGSRRGKGKKYRNLLLTFLVSGLWHGAGLPYLLWGALHGLLQILEDLLTPLRRFFTSRLKKGERSPIYRVPAVLFTFVLVDLC